MCDEKQFLNSELANQLTEIMATLIKERPSDGLSLFESLAHFSREGKLVPEAKVSPYLADEPKPRSQFPPKTFTDMAWAKRFANLVVPPKPAKAPPKEGEEEEEPEPEEPPEEKGDLADIVAEQAEFNRLGVGLREQEAYRVMVGLKRLLDSTHLKSARFWGKIMGLKSNYYIAETEVDPDAEPEQEEPELAAEDEDAEGRPQDAVFKTLNTYKAPKQLVIPPEAPNQPGLNRYRYYVAIGDDLTQWTQLPDVMPIHVQAARCIKKLFTGDLDAPVQCHPPFPGVERHYLRAQIARITHSCKVAPRGMYEAPAEDEEDEDAPPKTTFKRPPYESIPEITQPATDDLPEADDEQWQKEAFALWGKGYMHDKLLEVKNWIHIEPAILQTQGRATEFKPEPEENEEEEAAAEEEDTGPKPPIELVSPMCCELDKDDELRFEYHSHQSYAPWAVRKAVSQPSSLAARTYLLKSLRWPGAYCYASVLDGKPSAEICNTYIGDGLKGGGTVIYSPQPPTMGAVEPIRKRIVLQRDSTPDDEAEYAPPPPPPPEVKGGEGDEEEEEEGED